MYIVSFRKVYRETRSLSFLAYILSSGSFPSYRYSLTRFIQEAPSMTSTTSNMGAVVLSAGKCTIITSSSSLRAKAYQAKQLARSLFSQATCSMTNTSNTLVSAQTTFRYFSIKSPLASYSPKLGPLLTWSRFSPLCVLR